MPREMGELVVDHSASPGLPADFARRVGYDPRFCGEGQVYRVATLCCSHCKGSAVKNPFRTRERHSCPKCDHHYICDGCAFEMTLPGYVHTPFEAKVDLHLKQAAMNRPANLILPFIRKET